MKIQSIIWKPQGVSKGYQRFCSGQTIDKEHGKIIKVQNSNNDVPESASESVEAVKSPL